MIGLSPQGCVYDYRLSSIMKRSELKYLTGMLCLDPHKRLVCIILQYMTPTFIKHANKAEEHVDCYMEMQLTEAS